MQILCLGLNHTTAPIQLRERLDFSPEALKDALTRFKDGQPAYLKDFSALAILSTCNRIELYAFVKPEADHSPDLFGVLTHFLAETRGVPVAEFEPHLYRFTDLEAATHLCRVAAGLDSLILGEPQILGQVAEAYEAAQTVSVIGPGLSDLFRTAIRAGKRARTETAISRNPTSLSSVAVQLAEQVAGNLPTRKVLVIGAGEMSELALQALQARGVRQITVLSRTYERALELTRRQGGEALPFGQLAEAIGAADVVISCTSAALLVVDAKPVQEAMRGRERPLTVIDIALPRDVDPAVGEIANVRLFDLDHLNTRLEDALAQRESEIPQVEAIVAEEVSRFGTWLKGADMLPVIAELRLKAEHIRQQELARTLQHLPDVDPQVRTQLEHLSEALVNKLLHEPTLRLRAEAATDRAAEFAETVRELFGLTGN